MVGWYLSMTDWRDKIIQRIEEDEGLVAGLTPEAASAVRTWCRDRVAEAGDNLGPQVAADLADELVAKARMVTEVINELGSGEPSSWLAARLDRVLPDGATALEDLRASRPLEDRILSVLSHLRTSPAG